MKRIGILAFTLATATVLATPAYAVQITGAFSIASMATPSGSPMLPVNGATGVQTTLGAATGLDFSTTGALTPGVAGNFNVNSANGTFAPLLNQTGQMKDFSFAGTGSAAYPRVPPTLVSFQVAAVGGFSFDLATIAVTGPQTDSTLNLVGTGIFHWTGFDATPGTFVFTGNSAGGTFSFSASEAATPVPEPGSMMLLGTGLLALGRSIRKRMV